MSQLKSEQFKLWRERIPVNWKRVYRINPGNKENYFSSSSF
jgi:hypothetical protein